MRQTRTERLRDRMIAVWRDRRGSVAIGAAAAMVMVTGAAALVIDIGMVHAERNRLQTVADLAALGAAQDLPNAAAASARALALIETGLECHKRRRGGPADQASEQAHQNVAERRPDRPGGGCGTYSASIGSDAISVGHWDEAARSLRSDNASPSVVQVLLERNRRLDNAVPTTFGRLFGVDLIEVRAQAVATRGVASGMELALVLDVSGSMRGSKIQRLREISIALVDSLYAGQEIQRDLWISVVPFAGRVNIARYGRSWMALPPPITNLLCTGLRSGASKNDDTPPSVDRFPRYDLDRACPDARLLALTRERSVVRAELQALETKFGTSTQIGTVWGWRVLSPEWRGLWGERDLPHDYDRPGVRKVAVIMTDGRNTPHNAGDSFSRAEADAQLVAQCAAMKAAGIIIYTITFDAPASIDPLYQACASGPDKFHRASSADQLAEAFGTIGDRLIGRPRLIR